MSTEIPLDVEYRVHTCIMSGTNFDHTYTDISIDLMVMVEGYETTLRDIEVRNIPFWVNITDWTNGEDVDIAGLSCILSIEGNRWKASCDCGSSSCDIYYHMEISVFLEYYFDNSYLDTSGFSGSTTDIRIQQSNLEVFASRVTGRFILYNILLVTGIFGEAAIINKLIQRRRTKKPHHFPPVLD